MMEAVCSTRDTGCEVNALTAALHFLHIYCSMIAAVLLYCYTSYSPRTNHPLQWRWQNFRGIISIAVAITWFSNATAAALRPKDHVGLAAGLAAPPAWLAASWLHVSLWHRKLTSLILYTFLYWLLSAATSAANICYYLTSGITLQCVNFYIHIASTFFCLTLAAVDGICFYDEVADRIRSKTNSSKESIRNSSYQHVHAYFFSKITFFWLNKVLYKGYKTPLEQEDIGELPEEECSHKHYQKFKNIYDQLVKNREEKRIRMLNCFMKMVWPNFYISGILKLLGDILGLIPPLGLSIIVQYIASPAHTKDETSFVTIQEFICNGYVMVIIIALASIGQAILSQNSTHLVSIEGIRLKTALQSMIFDKCMLLSPCATASAAIEENEPLLSVQNDPSKTADSGLLTNLVSQDTYNVMSSVWVCHYIWAIPLKVGAILYLLYIKLGISAIIGCAVSILFVTPLQFYLGKKISDNSKATSKTSDHRISKMTEILQGITVIKLYVWEDLFKEKILCLREVELKHLNRDSVYWGFLTFITQASTILVTTITFTVYYLIEDSKELSVVNVFAGLALFSQLSIPLLVLPVTVLMVIQATISMKRIKEFLELPESHNVHEDIECQQSIFNDAFIQLLPEDNANAKTKKTRTNSSFTETKYNNRSYDEVIAENIFNNGALITFRNVIWTWNENNENSTSNVEIDNLEIEAGKLIMVVGSTGSGKSALLSAIVGEMTLQQGDVIWNDSCLMSYAGQPPWLLEKSVRDNIIMGSTWCQRRYARALRCTGLKPDLQLLPEGDKTVLGCRGAPLSGGQRVRVGVARALYSQAQLILLDEPLGALDAPLARHIVARALVPAVRSGRTVLLATNRLELLHYADMIIVMEDCRLVSYGRTSEDIALRRWNQLAAEAREIAARTGLGPAGGTARERSTLARALTRARLQRFTLDETSVGVNEATGVHLLPEVATYAGGSWRRVNRPYPTMLTRQFSSPPPSDHQHRHCRDIRRAVSADASNAALRREASMLRKFFYQRPHRTLSRWTPQPIRRLLSSTTNSNNNSFRLNGNINGSRAGKDDTSKYLTDDSRDSTHNDTDVESEDDGESENLHPNSWWIYSRVCGWWGLLYWCAATSAQGLAIAADWWLATWTAEQTQHDKLWQRVYTYAALCASSVVAAGCAQAACVFASGAARRKLHERLLHAALHASLEHYDQTPLGAMLHRFSADILIIDKKLPMTVCRWAQLALLCGSATLVNTIIMPWSLVAAVCGFIFYLTLQTVYRRNARELQRIEASTAAPTVSLVGEARAGAATIRAGRLQLRMRAEYLSKLDDNQNALLLLNATNRWLGLTLDLVGVGSVCTCLLAALATGRGAELAGLAGAYSLLLPAYLAHLAKSRADLDLHLAAVERVHMYSQAAQEDYRENCSVPDTWPENGEIKFEKVSIQHGMSSRPTLSDIVLTISSGEKVAICGRSGSGKSTLLMSCVGAASLCAGRLRVSGRYTDDLPLHAVRHRLVMLPQEVVLFSGTLRENLDPLAVHTDVEIWESLRVVGLHESVSAQPAGLESCAGSWRGGRSARLALARALLHSRRATALLLDEAGAALGAAAERALLRAVAAAAPHASVLTVAHRVSSVQDYDRVIVIEQGRIVEDGKPAALLAEPTTRFARMFAATNKHSNFSRIS